MKTDARLALVMVIAAVALAGTPLSARAQEDARALFERGTAAIHEGRFADARPDLERSLALDARPATAFNLVIALRGMGRLIDAGTACEALLAGEHGPLEDAQRVEAASICDDARRGVAHLRVRIGGTRPIEVRVDGVTLGDHAPGDEIDRSIDPGAHVVTAVAPGAEPVDRAVELARGASTELELAAPASARREEEGGPDIGLAVGLSLGGAALAAAIVVAVVLATASGPAPGDFPVTATLVRF